MSGVKLLLLGPPQIEHDGTPVDVNRRKAIALLAYLAVTGEPHTRDALATLLWPESDQSKARTYLRQNLWVLAKALGDVHFEVDRETIGLTTGDHLWVDVEAFRRRLAACETHAHPAAGVCSACIEPLTEAVDLYRDDFLAGFTLPDSPAFDEWQFFEAEGLRRELSGALERLARAYIAQREFEAAIPYARRRLMLNPLHEPAHRQVMQLYAWTGQHAAALRQYRECKRILGEELDIEPEDATTQLYQAIRARRPPLPPHRVTSTALPEADEAVEHRPVFVARERELAQLDKFLDTALAGEGQICFVTGEAGAGKTALITEFARRAQARHDSLVVAAGFCHTQTGIGDPYLPFRQVLEMLTGNIAAGPARGTVTRENATRLRNLLRISGRALVDHGPDLVDVLVPGGELVARVDTLLAESVDWLDGLNELIDRPAAARDPAKLEQTRIFDQYTRVLRALAGQQPLLLVLDDLQWADTASISLLFHLGRSITSTGAGRSVENRILILGAYRPHDVALGRSGGRHPLEPVLNELKRYRGDIWVTLNQTVEVEGRQFVDAFIDTEPNGLDEEFRQALFGRTRGHPLFTVELLRAMQERGDLTQDEEGRWIAQSVLDWETMPARVEGVIEERLGRLGQDLRDILTVASVEGEAFTAQVIVRVENEPERRLLRRLSHELVQRHRLVREQGTTQLDRRYLSHYRFAHVLFQQYLYENLSDGERRLLHGEIAQALAHLHAGHTDAISMQLAHHYLEAGQTETAVTYLEQAGDRAQRLVALDEAIRYYRTALEHWPATHQAGQARILRKLGECLLVMGHHQDALESLETGYELFVAVDDRVAAGETQRLIGRIYWERADRERALKHYKRALSILEQEPASVELARVVSSISQMHMLAYEFDEAAKWGERALALAERLGSEDVQVHTLNNLGVSYISRGSVDRGLAMLQRSLQQALDLKLPHDACRAYTNTAVMLMNLGRYEEPRALYEESVDYATQVHAHAFLAIAFARLIELDWVTGHWDIALSRWRQALDAISEVGRANVAGIYINTCYGWVYNDMGQAKVARSVLEEGLSHVRSKGEFQTTVPYLGQLARAYAALGLESQTAEVVAEILDVAEHAPYVHRYNTVSSFLFACRWLARRTTAESLDAARAHLHQSGRAYEEFGSPDAEAVLAEGKGSIASAEGDLARAAEQLEHAAALWDSLGRPYDQLRALVSLASAHRQMGNPDAARVACDAAQRLAEMLAAQIEDPELKTSFLNSELVQELRDIGKVTAGNPY